MGRCQKLSIILVIKWFKNWSYQKIFWELRKIQIIFDIVNWLWKSNFGTFWQFSKFNNFRWVRWFLGNFFSNFVPPAWKLNNLYCHNRHLDKVHFSCLLDFSFFHIFNIEPDLNTHLIMFDLCFNPMVTTKSNICFHPLQRKSDEDESKYWFKQY